MGGERSSQSVFADSDAIRGALEIARNSETGDLDAAVRDLLDKAIGEIWERIHQNPTTYILTRDEFAVFNYFIDRFQGNELAQAAIQRYWDDYSKEGGNADSL